jgi:hypothetical protein
LSTLSAFIGRKKRRKNSNLKRGRMELERHDFLKKKFAKIKLLRRKQGKAFGTKESRAL